MARQPAHDAWLVGRAGDASERGVRRPVVIRPKPAVAVVAWALGAALASGCGSPPTPGTDGERSVSSSSFPGTVATATTSIPPAAPSASSPAPTLALAPALSVRPGRSSARSPAHAPATSSRAARRPSRTTTGSALVVKAARLEDGCGKPAAVRLLVSRNGVSCTDHQPFVRQVQPPVHQTTQIAADEPQNGRRHSEGITSEDYA